MLSALRLDLVERRLRDQPAALDGAESAEVATAAVAGVDALETTFARYLPQVVLAVVVPVAVLVLVASIDLVSAGLMLLTLPLVPVFMWLVGRYTEQRTRERWQALALLATHFLDVVRGLPTLRAFNRGEAQARADRGGQRRYRRTTMGTLRVAFLSGTVLELAATLGIALVAVTVGVRLVNGGIGFEAGADRARARARALPAAAQPRRAVPRERRRPRRCRAPARPGREPSGGRAPPACAAAAEPARRARPARGRLVRLSRTRRARCSTGVDLELAPGRDGRARRPERRRQEHGRLAPAAARRADRGTR